MKEFVKTNINAKGVAEIVFFHPKSNSLPAKMLRNLANQIQSAGENSDVKLIILKSNGEKTFCAGASFDELINISDVEQGKEFFMGFARVIEAIRNAPKLVISRVQNKAVGGGVGIICASDYSVGTVNSSLKLSELNVGIGPFVIGPVVEKRIGQSLYTKLALEADWITAKWALDHGIFSKISPTIDEMDTYINQFVDHLLSKNMEAIKKIKCINWNGYEDLDILLEKRAKMSGELVVSKFTKNFIRQFKSI